MNGVGNVFRFNILPPYIDRRLFVEFRAVKEVKPLLTSVGDIELLGCYNLCDKVCGFKYPNLIVNIVFTPFKSKILQQKQLLRSGLLLFKDNG
ncbi:hypothetical protein SDC9_207917 [bioreactor metagenome]|uniref:Uncharacterized protein n=1 Tax=bioreactor metagenome TaxID=1076179 RepID=A0A645JAQ0_9ZZZZ